MLSSKREASVHLTADADASSIEVRNDRLRSPELSVPRTLIASSAPTSPSNRVVEAAPCDQSQTVTVECDVDGRMLVPMHLQMTVVNRSPRSADAIKRPPRIRTERNSPSSSQVLKFGSGDHALGVVAGLRPHRSSNNKSGAGSSGSDSTVNVQMMLPPVLQRRWTSQVAHKTKTSPADVGADNGGVLADVDSDELRAAANFTDMISATSYGDSSAQISDPFSASPATALSNSLNEPASSNPEQNAAPRGQHEVHTAPCEPDDKSASNSLASISCHPGYRSSATTLLLHANVVEADRLSSLQEAIACQDEAASIQQPPSPVPKEALQNARCNPQPIQRLSVISAKQFNADSCTAAASTGSCEPEPSPIFRSALARSTGTLSAGVTRPLTVDVSSPRIPMRISLHRGVPQSQISAAVMSIKGDAEDGFTPTTTLPVPSAETPLGIIEPRSLSVSVTHACIDSSL